MDDYAIVNGRAVMTVFDTYIKATPERVWEALTDLDMRAKFSFGAQTKTDWKRGSRYKLSFPGGVDIAEGEIAEVDPPRLLVHTWTGLSSDEAKNAEPLRITWEIEPVGTSCRVRVILDQLPDGANAEELCGNKPMMLAGLKTLLETGELLDTPDSLRYAETVG